VLVLVLLRHRGLLDLPRQRVLGIVDVEVADELLGDRRGALLDLAGLGVGDAGADDRAVVDAAVLVEVRVLDRDRRLLQRGRDLLELDRLAEDVGLDVAEAVAGGIEDLRVGAIVGGSQRVDVGSTLRTQIARPPTPAATIATTPTSTAMILWPTDPRERACRRCLERIDIAEDLKG